MNTGKIIREFRLLNHLTQKELADKLNISHNNLSMWEKGKSLPTTIHAIELAKLFNISLDYLLCLTNEDDIRLIESNPLPPDEERLLQEYRKLNIPLKKVCYNFVEAMVDTAESRKVN